MDLTNEFRVPVPPEQAWEVLTDLPRIAPCMPGAELQEIDGDDHRGVIKVKVGPITAQYRGTAKFLEQEAPRRAVLRAEGRETRGQGNASATITATLEPDGDGTKVVVATDLTITGKVAQFGRGVLADVSAKLLGEFATCLESTVLAGGGAEGDEEREAATSGPAVRGETKPVDLVATAGAPVAKRAAPVAAAVAVLWLLGVFLRRRRRRKR